MSEIPFVKRLGDAIEEAIAAPRRARRPRRRRLGGLAVAVLLLGAGGVTVAEILDDPERLATGSLACYDSAELDDANVTVMSGDGRSPIAACAEVMGHDGPVPPLVACVRHEHVAVFPGEGPGACERAGLRPLPGGYGPARANVARLERALLALERRADCIAPQRLARRAQAVLDRLGWTGWAAVVRGGDGGPCGWIHDVEGGGLGGALDGEREELVVYRGPPRSLERRLRRASDRLRRDSGRRCFTAAGLRAHARGVLARADRPVRFASARPPAEGTQILPLSAHRRYEQGCAVARGAGAAYPAPGAIVVEVEILTLRGPAAAPRA